ncbi:MAG TPA: BON domain-containing protein [Gemmataceae bacterium]|nr:BON domain-containing protein [Gemmataceae bacterium]
MARRIGSKEVPVTVRKLIPLAAAFGLWAAGPVEAQQMPVPSASKKENQDLADAVATKLKKSGAVGKGSKVDISVRDGVVDLSGTVTSHKQHEEILRTLTSVKGIKRIESAIQVVGEGPAPTAAAPEMMITPAAMTSPAPMMAPPVPPAPAMMPVKPAAMEMPAPTPELKSHFSPLQRTAGQAEGGPIMPPSSPISALPPLGAAPGMAMTDPVPLNGMPAMAPIDPAGPRMPPYAWPTYAPYNNYSRVAYPAAYPYNAFPYIGPFYPFPKVPLGWRKVVLEWEDGHWYIGQLSSPYDYWRVKFW